MIFHFQLRWPFSFLFLTLLLTACTASQVKQTITLTISPAVTRAALSANTSILPILTPAIERKSATPLSTQLIDYRISETPSLIPILLTTPSSRVTNPGRIVFISDFEGYRAIYTVNSDGTALFKVADDLTWIANPAWSPDGAWIAFSAYSRQDKHDAIFLIRPDGSELTQLNPTSVDQAFPTWSPDGMQIAYIVFSGEDSELIVERADGSEPIQITHNHRRQSNPVWSPDGNWIAYSSDSVASPGLYLIHPDGSGEMQLTSRPLLPHFPSWSPDSSRIAFSAVHEYKDEAAAIYVINADGSNLIRLGQDKGDQMFPTWSPDGKHLAYNQTDASGNYEIIVLDTSDGNLFRILKLSARIDDLAWGVSLNLSPTATSIAPSVTPIPASPDDWKKAQQTLMDYFNYFSTSQYDRAAGLYGGPYELLMEGNPDIEPHNRAALLEYACQSRYQCLRVKTIHLMDQTLTRFKFTLEFINKDGSLLVLGPCCGADETQQPPVSTFVFTVIRIQSGQFLVMDLPVAGA